MKGSVIAVAVALILIVEEQVSPIVAFRVARNPQRGGWIGGGIGVGGGTWAGNGVGAGAGPGMQTEGNNVTNYGFGFGYIPGMGFGKIPGEEFGRYWEKFANFGKFGRR